MGKLTATKRFVLVLMILMVSLGIGVYSAYAIEPGKVTESNTIISGSGSWQNPLIPRAEEQPDIQHTILSTGETAEATDLTKLKSAIQQGFIQRQASFSIHYTGDTSNLTADIKQIIDEIFADDDYLKYSRKGCGWGYDGYVNDVTISFTASYVSTREQEDYVEQQVPIILDQIIGLEMSTLEKVKSINDYIVLNTKYSETTSDPSISPHSAYALLKEGQGVCQGYALLAYKMLQETGIPVRIIEGNAGGGGHAWNLVQISNQWYHLDVTWNDSLPNCPGQVNYNYFLRNNTIANDHSWDTSVYPATTDNSFAYFHEMLYASSKGENIYYSHQSYGNQLYRSSIDGTDQQKLNNNRSYYITVAGNWIYYSNYSYGGYLFKIRTDGRDESLIVAEHAINTYVKDNILYYTGVESGAIEIYPLPTYSIAISTEPVEGGTVSGGSSYLEGDTVTLAAIANKGYTFTKWTENGTGVSTDINYTFTANQDRNLTAEFRILSNDATLNSIEIDGNCITGFNSTTETYDVELPYGTTVVPTVTAAVTDTGKASAVINPATSLPGLTMIIVTAEDGTTTKTYTIEFTVENAALPTDSTIVPSTVTIDIAQQEDFQVTVNWNGNTLVSINDGSRNLEPEYLNDLHVISVRVKADFSNLRSGSSTKFDVVGTTSSGDELTAISEKDGWYEVEYQGETAWIGGWLVDVIQSTNKDYSIFNNKITVYKSYLANRPIGNTVLTFKFSSGANQVLTVNIIDATTTSIAAIPEQISVINNEARTPDKVMITGLISGDEVYVYKNLTDQNPIATGVVEAGSNSVDIIIQQVGSEAGVIYVSIKNIGKNESTRTPKEYSAETPMDECFIATAAFGSKFTWPVTLLRDFRDQYLLTNSWGTAFVSFYYQHSPPIAAIISNNQTLKTMVRVLLAPLVASVFLLYHPLILLLIITVVILIKFRFITGKY